MIQVRFAGIEGVQIVHRDVEKAQSLDVDIENGDVRAETFRHSQRIYSRSATTDDYDAPGQHTRHTAKQHAAAAIVFRQIICAHHYRHATRNFTHWLEQRQTTVHLDRFVSDAGDAGIEQGFGQRFARGEVKISKKNLALAQKRILRLQRFLHLDDHVRAGPYVFSEVDYFRAGNFI